jgi:hypothetical protein
MIMNINDCDNNGNDVVMVMMIEAVTAGGMN